MYNCFLTKLFICYLAVALIFFLNNVNHKQLNYIFIAVKKELYLMFLLSFISITQTETVHPHAIGCAKNISIRVDSNMLLKTVAHTINKCDYVWHTMF